MTEESFNKSYNLNGYAILQGEGEGVGINANQSCIKVNKPFGLLTVHMLMDTTCYIKITIKKY